MRTPVAACMVAWLAVAGAPAADRWLLVDTAALTLSIMSGDRIESRFEDVSIGSSGASAEKRGGDGATPLGRYRVTEVRRGEKTRFHVFIALDYPSVVDAEKAHSLGDISGDDLQAIRRAHRTGAQPPGNTPLGGNIGIHGIGRGDPRIHAAFNWTDGCVALLNEEIDALADVVFPGMTVVIQ